MEINLIKKGTKVTYVKTIGSNARTLKFATREGVLLDYTDTICLIKTKNGKTVWIDTKTVSPADGQRTALAEYLLENLDCNHIH